MKKINDEGHRYSIEVKVNNQMEELYSTSIPVEKKPKRKLTRKSMLAFYLSAIR